MTNNLPDATFVWGYAYPRWDNFFRANDAKMMRRTAYGTNIRHDLSPNLTTGINFIRTEDDKRQFANQPLYDNNVYSLDYEYRPIPGMTVRGEEAFSHSRGQQEDHARFSTYFGHAHRIETIMEGGPSRVNLDYEYVNPKFETFTGSAISNRQRARARWRYQPARNSTITSAFMWQQSGLADINPTVNTFRPEIGIQQRNLFGRRTAQGGLDYRMNMSSGNHRKTNDHFINVNYRDRIGFLETDNRFGFNTFNTSKRNRKTLEYNYNTSLSSRHRVGEFVFRPLVNAGTSFIDDEIRNTLDKLVDYSVGLGIDIPKHRITSNFRFGQNILNPGMGDNSNKLFTNMSVYYRPGFVGFLDSSTFYLRVAINDYNFSSRTRNFAEKSISMGMNLPIDLFVGKKKDMVEKL